MNTFADRMFHILKFGAALCLAGMVAMVFGNVVLRYAFNTGISATEELASWGLAYITYIAGLIALREHGHLGFDSVVKSLPAWAQRACYIVAHMLMIALAGMFLHGSWAQTMINLNNAAPASGLSLGWLYGVGIVFGAVAILVLLIDLFRAASGKAGEAALVMVESEASEALAEAKRHKHEDPTLSKLPI